MVRSSVWVGILLAALTVSACKGESKPAEGITKGSATATDPADKAKVTTDKPEPPAKEPKVFDGPSFTVQHDRAPKTSDTDVPTAAGVMKMTTYMFGAPSANVMFAVMTSKLPDAADGADPAEMIKDAKTGMIAKYDAKVSRDDAVKIGATDASDFAATGVHPQLGKYFMRGRVSIHDKMLYQVLVLGAGHTEPAAAGKFVESFAFKQP